jgi:hypothetical protein
MIAALSSAQTQVDLRTQAKNVDFSAAAETRPFKMGTSLPPSCLSGDMYFKTDSPAGTNLFTCLSGNWTQVDGNRKTDFQASLSDGRTSNTPTTVNVEAGTFRSGNAVTTVASPAAIESGFGALRPGAQIWIEFDPVTHLLFLISNAAVTQSNLTLTNIVAGSAAASSFTSGRIPIAVCSGGAQADQWTACTDARSPFSTTMLNAGPGIQVVPQSNGSLTVSGTLTRAFGVSFDGGGVPLPAGVTRYVTVPFACAIAASNLLVDTGTATVKIWKTGTGNSLPSADDSISINGISIFSGTSLHTDGTSDFTSTAVAANDVFGFNLAAADSATYVNFVLECAQR